MKLTDKSLCICIALGKAYDDQKYDKSLKI